MTIHVRSVLARATATNAWLKTLPTIPDEVAVFVLEDAAEMIEEITTQRLVILDICERITALQQMADIHATGEGGS